MSSPFLMSHTLATLARGRNKLGPYSGAVLYLLYAFKDVGNLVRA